MAWIHNKDSFVALFLYVCVCVCCLKAEDYYFSFPNWVSEQVASSQPNKEVVSGGSDWQITVSIP